MVFVFTHFWRHALLTLCAREECSVLNGLLWETCSINIVCPAAPNGFVCPQGYVCSGISHGIGNAIFMLVQYFMCAPMVYIPLCAPEEYSWLITCIVCPQASGWKSIIVCGIGNTISMLVCALC